MQCKEKTARGVLPQLRGYRRLVLMFYVAKDIYVRKNKEEIEQGELKLLKKLGVVGKWTYDGKRRVWIYVFCRTGNMNVRKAN